MISAKQIALQMGNNSLPQHLIEFYRHENTEMVCSRLTSVLQGFFHAFGMPETIGLFSAPGRAEIGGNHTDHQRGHVLAAAINLDTLGAAARNDTNQIHLQSEGYGSIQVDLADTEMNRSEYGTSGALLRGIAMQIKQMGYPVSGFNAYVSSQVLSGSGLSSSAAFEVWVGTVINHLFCKDQLSPVSLAKIGQYAENIYFGKPCGLMDQTACAVGGVIAIDFNNLTHPEIRKITANFRSHALCIIDSGGSHAGLTSEYASIPNEMKLVASAFGKEHLRDVDKQEFLLQFSELRQAVGDRAMLRALHFFIDNSLAVDEAMALEKDDFDTFLNCVRKSGQSSSLYLQNIFKTGAVQHQDVAVALALCNEFLGNRGAYRVHGGGFAGTVQAFVPQDMLKEFQFQIESILGSGSCHVLHVRSAGATVLL